MSQPKLPLLDLSSLNGILRLGGLLAIGYGLLPGSAIAQTIPDGTTPTSLSSLNAVTGCPGTCITGGYRGDAGTGTNVFHSFSTFNIGNGETFTFNNEPTVENIFSRVTTLDPLNVSNIDGTLGVNGDANLFFLNPNGIVFSESAMLDIEGSFLSTTADRISFGDRGSFGTAETSIPSLLTVSAPLGLQFGSTPAPITVQGSGSNMRYSSRGIRRNFPTAPPSGLRVNLEENLALIGGNISLQGGNLIAEGGHVEIGSIGDEGFVGFDDSGSQWQFNYDQVADFQDIFLTQGSDISQPASVDVSSADAGSIQLNGREITLDSGSTLLAQVTGANGSGDIAINAADNLELTGVTLGPVLMQTSAYVEIGPSGTGDGTSSLSVNAPEVELTGGAQIGMTMAGSGDSGRVEIRSSKRINVDGVSNVGPSSLFTTVAPLVNTPESARGGSLDIGTQQPGDTSQINITNGAQVAANTFGPGIGGDLSVQADEITVSGFGAGGPSLLSTSSQTAPTDSLGPPTQPPLLIPNGDGSGNSGSATIDTRRLTVLGGGQVITGTNSNNAGGDLTINASESIELVGQTASGRSGIFSGARQGSGSGGDIDITTAELSVLEGATVNSSNFPSSPNSPRSPGTGPAGNIDVRANAISIKDGSLITADTVAGDHANITLQSDSIVLRRGSSNQGSITTDATGPATGGDITITTEALVALENSDITANAQDNFGGRVTVNAATILGTAFREQLTPASDITASSALGPAFSGSVEINNPEVDPTDGITALSSEPTNGERVIAACGKADSLNTFIATGRGGLPEDASQLMTGQSVWNDFRLAADGFLSDRSDVDTSDLSDAEQAPTVAVPLAIAEAQIAEAQTWSLDGQGRVVLASTTETTSVSHQTTGCLS
ncbi:MAG: filamentous hemagglutinin N-terminal domain-containing protein [Cyanobacteria bacterium P01_D01_bin.1]